MGNKRREHYWYVEPLDTHTNEVFSRILPPQNAKGQIQTNKGKRNLWLCASFGDVVLFRESREQIKISFGVFVQEGRNGAIRERTKLFARKKSRPQA